MKCTSEKRVSFEKTWDILSQASARSHCHNMQMIVNVSVAVVVDDEVDDGAFWRSLVSLSVCILDVCLWCLVVSRVSGWLISMEQPVFGRFSFYQCLFVVPPS